MQTFALHQTCLRQEYSFVGAKPGVALPSIKRPVREYAEHALETTWIQPVCSVASVMLSIAFAGVLGPSRTSSAVRAVDNPIAALVADKRFKCTECGKCCTGSGEVWVSDAECAAIALHLDLPIEQFQQQYCKSFNEAFPGWRVLKYKAGSVEASMLPSCMIWQLHQTLLSLVHCASFSFGCHACVNLLAHHAKDSKIHNHLLQSWSSIPPQECVFLDGKLCSIYSVRPVQCATYPWWPELMNSVAWQLEGREICEGFDHPDAAALDIKDAAAKLKLASEHFVIKKAEGLQHFQDRQEHSS